MVYLLEDDNNICELVIYTLNTTGIEAKGFDRPSAFWTAMEERHPQLVLLDIMLPEEDGLQVLSKLRAHKETERIPVMMLTAKGSEYDKVKGLNEGADDYLAKPFGMMELVARVKALLRRFSDRSEEKKYEIGKLSVDHTRHVVRCDGKSVTLTLKEYEMLHLMLENPGVVFTRDQLLNRIWGYGFDGESRTVDVHIRTLRQKLGECGDYIETVRGIGYKIDGEKRV